MTNFVSANSYVTLTDLSYKKENRWYLSGEHGTLFFNTKEEAEEHARYHGLKIKYITEDYLESLDTLDELDLISLGVEEPRAATLTEWGTEPIQSDGEVVYFAYDYFWPHLIYDFVTEANTQPFDYDEGVYTCE